RAVFAVMDSGWNFSLTAADLLPRLRFGQGQGAQKPRLLLIIKRCVERTQRRVDRCKRCSRGVDCLLHGLEPRRWRCGLILWALGGDSLRCCMRRGPQRLQRGTLLVIGRGDPRDVVEWQILEPSRLRHAAADQAIYDCAEIATAGPGAPVYDLGV